MTRFVNIDPGVVSWTVTVVVAVADPFAGVVTPPLIKTERPVCGVAVADPLTVAGGFSNDPTLRSARKVVRLADSAAKLRPMVVGAD